MAPVEKSPSPGSSSGSAPSEGLSRRQWLLSAAAGAAAAGLSGCTARPKSGLSNGPVHYATATTLLAALQNKEISSEELVKLLLDRLGSMLGARHLGLDHRLALVPHTQH